MAEALGCSLDLIIPETLRQQYPAGAFTTGCPTVLSHD
jgi:hypothetical protein